MHSPDNSTLIDATATGVSLGIYARGTPLKIKHRNILLTTLMRRKPENAGLHRLAAIRELFRAGRRAPTDREIAEAAYPVEDRPRGDDDVRSVMWYLKRLRAAEKHKLGGGQGACEICIVLTARKDGSWVMLDGVHRLMALYALSYLTGSDTRVDIYMLVPRA